MKIVFKIIQAEFRKENIGLHNYGCDHLSGGVGAGLGYISVVAGGGGGVYSTECLQVYNR